MDLCFVYCRNVERQCARVGREGSDLWLVGLCADFCPCLSLSEVLAKSLKPYFLNAVSFVCSPFSGPQTLH